MCPDQITSIPIHCGILPSDFHYDPNLPKCINYPIESCKNELILEKNNRGIPGNMSQSSNNDHLDTLDIHNLNSDVGLDSDNIVVSIIHLCPLHLCNFFI